MLKAVPVCPGLTVMPAIGAEEAGTTGAMSRGRTAPVFLLAERRGLHIASPPSAADSFPNRRLEFCLRPAPLYVQASGLSAAGRPSQHSWGHLQKQRRERRKAAPAPGPKPAFTSLPCSACLKARASTKTPDLAPNLLSTIVSRKANTPAQPHVRRKTQDPPPLALRRGRSFARRDDRKKGAAEVEG